MEQVLQKENRILTFSPENSSQVKLNKAGLKKAAMLFKKRAALFKQLMYCKATKKRAPIITYILITNKCNLRCKYCFVDVANAHKQKELSTQEILDLIDELERQGTKMIVLMGGEPLLHPDIDKIIDKIVSKGMICDMTTNALLLPHKLETVKKVDAIMVSLDGDELAHDANRGQGTFKKVIESIKLARKNGILVRINTVLSKKNLNSIEYILDLADKYDLFVTFAIMEGSVNGPDSIKDISLSGDEIRAVYKKLKEFKSRGRRVLFSDHTLDYVINYPLAYDQIILKNDKEHMGYYKDECLYGRTMCYIDGTGKVYPCAVLWNVDFFKPKQISEVCFRAAFDNFADLPCHTCFQPGCSEWSYITSPAGLIHTLQFSFKQVLSNILNKHMNTGAKNGGNRCCNH